MLIVCTNEYISVEGRYKVYITLYCTLVCQPVQHKPIQVYSYMQVYAVYQSMDINMLLYFQCLKGS